MSDYVIATASTCDLDRNWLDEHNIPLISYTFEIDGKVYVDDCRAETRHIIYKEMREGKMPNTSQITTYNYYEFFRKLLSGGKSVIFADMDRAISSSFFNSTRAAEQIREEMPDADLYIMDTRCITTGLGFLIRHMTALKEEGKSKEEVIAWGENNKLKIAHRFMVDDLQWLRKGGRLSNAASIVGSLLSIKPLIYLPDDGSLVAYEKVRGRKKAIHKLLESTEKDIGDTVGKEIVLSHSDCEEDGKMWLQTVQERYPAANVTLQELGPVIGSHIGPGFLSIVYLTDKRMP